MKYFSIIVLLLFPFFGRSQAKMAEKKSISAIRSDEKIKIDGVLDEAIWATAAPAKEFYFSWPTPGNPATQKTEVRVIYNDDALYVGAKMFDTQPDSIMHRLSKRDELQNTDYFSLVLDTYQDGQNAVLFSISPDNVQYDSKFSIANANPDNGDPDGEDSSWDAVWMSSARIVEDGWIAEFEIPYSALRFPKKDIQHWNINFYRFLQRHSESNSWNEIKAEIAGSLPQMGHLEAIKDIKTPVRLSVTPFVSAYANNAYNQGDAASTAWDFPYNFGMDLKYGLNEAFTLDATLIPDFGQVRTDNFVLNLSPFEVRFNENRQFFTEGTELFNKGGLFYSRRIGGRPYHFWDAFDAVNEDAEELKSNPRNAQLINATKVSGRTQSGLGVGIFNAIEAPTEAVIKNIETGEERRIETSSLTNKNVLVFDQNLANNSAITILNTNVMRSGSDPDANVTGLMYNLKNKAQSYSLSGKGVYSAVFKNDGKESGFATNINFQKTSGNFLFGLESNIESDTYNPNDLGFLYNNNENAKTAWVNYSRYKPWWKLNNFWSSMWIYHETLYKPNLWTVTSMGLNFGGNTKSFQNFGTNMRISPYGYRDYFEARVEGFGHYFQTPTFGQGNFWYNSDRRKNLRFYANGGLRKFKGAGRYNVWANTGINWQLSDKFIIGLGIGREEYHKNEGWTWQDETSEGYDQLSDADILMGRREIRNFENDFNLSYSFTSRINLQVFGRHYWSNVKYSSFHLLQDNGRFGDAPAPYKGLDEDGTPTNNIAANYFNVDCVFTWRFAPGSDILVVYKNNVFNDAFGHEVEQGYLNNLGRLGTFPGTNSLSVKVLYFLDYNKMKHLKS